MNIGIQEAIELARFLKITIEEGISPGIGLDRYEAARRLVAIEAMSMTHRFTTVSQWKSSWARCARNWYVELFLQISGLQLNKMEETSCVGLH